MLKFLKKYQNFETFEKKVAGYVSSSARGTNTKNLGGTSWFIRTVHLAQATEIMSQPTGIKFRSISM